MGGSGVVSAGSGFASVSAGLVASGAFVSLGSALGASLSAGGVSAPSTSSANTVLMELKNWPALSYVMITDAVKAATRMVAIAFLSIKRMSIRFIIMSSIHSFPALQSDDNKALGTERGQK